MKSLLAGLPAPESQPHSQPPAAPHFAVSTNKLAVLSVFSFGFYQIYWFYKHWRCERARTGEDLWPLPRAIFGVLFAYSLFKRIRTHALAQHAQQVKAFDGAGALAAAYFIMTFSPSRLPDPLLASVSLRVPSVTARPGGREQDESATCARRT